ncbi:unnamed protein product [Caenorhabditis auriculariae]|uniref:Uncharacterized protein n=1 Tax=Caenorhabditis auriculariae TaxID=2777116 RepID=A0A8S1HDF4_9PELO|nr:unnamed protein product [Caenorhabditis auriculariae]CAD6194513.1 unnamed protein product [Caenorhabditis auriculariae]
MIAVAFDLELLAAKISEKLKLQEAAKQATEQRRAAFEHRLRLEDQWVARLQSMQTSDHEVQAEFRKLFFQFVRTPEIATGSITRYDAQHLLSLSQSVLNKLDDEVVMLDLQINELAKLYRQSSQKVILEIQRVGHLIRYESVRLSQALHDFQYNCSYGSIFFDSLDEIKNYVECLRIAVSQVPAFVEIREQLQL